MILRAYYVVGPAGERLCGDGRVRGFAQFGTFRECVKVYKSYPYARAAAKKVAKGLGAGYVLQVELNGYTEINAAGHLFSEIDGKSFSIKDLIDGKVVSESFKLIPVAPTNGS